MPSKFVNDPSNPNPVYLSEEELASFIGRPVDDVQFELIQQNFFTRIYSSRPGGAVCQWGVTIHPTHDNKVHHVEN